MMTARRLQRELMTGIPALQGVVVAAGNHDQIAGCRN
jgi:hypothetical protein